MTTLLRNRGLGVRAAAVTLVCLVLAAGVLGPALAPAPARAHVSGYCGHHDRIGPHFWTQFAGHGTIRRGNYRYHVHVQIHYRRPGRGWLFTYWHMTWRICWRHYVGPIA